MQREMRRGKLKHSSQQHLMDANAKYLDLDSKYKKALLDLEIAYVKDKSEFIEAWKMQRKGAEAKLSLGRFQLLV